MDVIELDVASDNSVAEAAKAVRDGDRGATPLYAVVNNAGVPAGPLAEVFNVNVYGVHRVSEHFLPLVEEGGRVVNITSAAGPNFVAQCSAEWQRFFTHADVTWDQLDQFMSDCLELDADEFAEKGLGSGASYGLSKACANAYTLCLAAAHPQLLINACTPGFIETDLGLRFIGDRTPEEAGMKKPEDGARVAMVLLFEALQGSGHYYGSDAKRSPLDRYREPGSPAYTGE